MNQWKGKSLIQSLKIWLIQIQRAQMLNDDFTVAFKENFGVYMKFQFDD